MALPAEQLWQLGCFPAALTCQAGSAAEESKDTPSERGRLGKEGFGGEMNFSVRGYELILGCEVWGASALLRSWGFPAPGWAGARHRGKTDAAERAQPVQVAGRRMKAALRALPVGTQLLPHPSSSLSPLCIHKQAQTRKDRQVSLASI